MRDITYRAKRKDNGEWIEGNLVWLKNWKDEPYECFVISHLAYLEYGEFDDTYTVIPETVGQYTGLTDKNGKKIFEGDIVKNDWCFMCGNSVVKFGQYKPLDMGNEYQQGHLGFYLEHIHKADKRSVRKDIMYFANNCEIIGNIHDNKDLLEVK